MLPDIGLICGALGGALLLGWAMWKDYAANKNR